MSVEFSYINQMGRNQEMEEAIKIPEKGDGYDEIRLEFRTMLKDQSLRAIMDLKSLNILPLL